MESDISLPLHFRFDRGYLWSTFEYTSNSSSTARLAWKEATVLSGVPVSSVLEASVMLYAVTRRTSSEDCNRNAWAQHDLCVFLIVVILAYLGAFRPSLPSGSPA